MVTINPFNTYYRQDKSSPVSVSATGISHKALWEFAGNGEIAGTFGVLEDDSVLFFPINKTQAVSVKVFDALKPTWGTVDSQIAVAADKLTYSTAGTAGHYYGAVGNETYTGSGDCFVQVIAGGPLLSRGFGLSASPHNYDWHSADFDYAINLGQNGSGSIWVAGTQVGGFTYYNDNYLSVGVESGKVCFRINSKLMYQHTPGSAPANLHPIVSFYDLTAELGPVRFWRSSTEGKAEAWMDIWGVLPICQDKMSEHEATEIAEVSEAESQRGQDKVVRYHQRQDKWDLVFTGRRLDELQTLRGFRDFHRIHIPFFINDAARGLDKLVVFETGIKDRLVLANSFDFSCTVKEY